ncbi:MAG: hypothetical protein EHM64_17045 [Ignavibacteriae bacterium]|nr:MAG: hypothetical protein EHM64_17045 [Ignavibacteriota bacterium]
MRLLTVPSGQRYSPDGLNKRTEVTTHNNSFRLTDFGFHLWPSPYLFLVLQPFTIGPTASSSKEEPDAYLDGFRHVAEEARKKPETLKNTPHRSVVHKIDESTFDDPQ